LFKAQDLAAAHTESALERGSNLPDNQVIWQSMALLFA
jgi:superfamily II helicase